MSQPCDRCGEHRWAKAGFCLSVECAGIYTDPDYPLSAPPEHKWYTKDAKRSFTKSRAKVKFPPKGTRRALELQYESRGEVAPWLQKNEPAS